MLALDVTLVGGLLPLAAVARRGDTLSVQVPPDRCYLFAGPQGLALPRARAALVSPMEMPG